MHLRHVVAKKLPFPVISVAIDETRAVLRLLYERNAGFVPENASEGDADALKTTAQLASSFFGNRDTYYEIDGKQYFIYAEGILDKTSLLYSRNWVPGAHYSFHLDPARGIFVDVRPELSYLSKRNSANYAKYAGGMWLFDLWVTDQTAPVSECNRSITTAPDTILVSNITDLGEDWDADVVMQGDQSKWLNLGYELTPDVEEVAPDGWVTYTLKLLDGKTGDLLSTINWDGFIVEAADGYDPRRRVESNNGVGTFRQQALGLQSGETMRVKINHRFYTGRAEHTVTVK